MRAVNYGSTLARVLLGATAHPGGVPLSRHLLDLLELTPGSLVADVACGRGSTLDLLAERGHLPVGVDLSSRHVRAVLGDAHALPLAASTYDAVLCECSVSTFARPKVALAEAARVLRPGGRYAMTDVLLDRERAGPVVVAAVDRLTGARSVQAYAGLLEGAGLQLVTVEDRGAYALALVRRLRRRLPWSGVVRACEQAVRTGALGYGLFLARKP
jgi:arsenite methyltransferase